MSIFFRIAAGCVWLILCLTGLGCGQAAPSEPLEQQEDSAYSRVRVRLQSDWYPQAEHGGYYQALARGWYAQVGLDVEILPGGPGARPYLRTAAGEADLVMARSDDIILQIAKGGLPLVLIAAEMQRDPQGILVHESSSVRSLQDLDGRVVMATPSAAWIPYVKARYGIEFELIPLNFGLGAFLADPAFIQQCLVTNEPYLARAKGARVRALMVADSGYDPYRVLAARRGFLQAEPEAAAAFVAVSIRGWEDFLFGDPTPALDEIGRRNGTLPRDQLLWSRSEVIRLALVTGKPERGERIGLLKRKRLQEELKRLADLGLIPGTLQVEDVARLDLLPKSLRDAALRP